MNPRRICGAALGAALLLVTGCYDIEQLIKLNPDLSGEASMKIGVNMESMIKIMASLERQFSGKEGPPSAEELEKAKKEFLEKNKQDKEKEKAEFDEKKKQLEEKLPKGVTLKSIEMKELNEGLKIEVAMTFAFDHVSKLKEIEFPKEKPEGEEQGGGGPPGPQELDRPFEGVDVVETADTVQLVIKPANPAKEPKAKDPAAGGEGGEEGGGEGGPADEGMKQMIKDALSTLKVGVKVDCPLEVAKHNANEQKGTVLGWVYDIAKLEKMEKAGEKPVDVIDVTYKKAKK